jgi:ethanolamine ammonia-lyase small subunit
MSPQSLDHELRVSDWSKLVGSKVFQSVASSCRVVDMNSTAAVTRKVRQFREINGRTLARLSYVRQGESVDTTTGEVFRTVYGTGSRLVRGYVTEQWMRNHGWIY